ncbi:MAG: hypothetical protein ACYDHO_05075 [Gaiellaceae bacterium]
MSEQKPIPGNYLCESVSFDLSLPFLQASCGHCEHFRKHSGKFGSIALFEKPRSRALARELR